MEIQVTIKAKLKVPNSETALSFSKTMEQYRQACNYVSEYIFNIQLLGTQYISGQEQPKFELTTNVKRVLSTTR